MSRKQLTHESGISLIELMVVLVITGIMVAFAVAQLGNSKQEFQVQNVAKELQSYMVRARYDSVKRRPPSESQMSSVSIDSATKFTVNLDFNNDGVLAADEIREVDFAGRTDVSILGDGISLPIVMNFDRHGHVYAFDALGNLVNPRFVICDKCAGQDGSTAVGFRISLSSSGTVSLERTSESVAIYATPAVTNVSSSQEIEPLVYIRGSNSNSSTPTPTPSATPTPTGSPSPAGSPTPAPSPTPTPPPVNICVKNERPSHTGCVCQAPMSVSGNGQCK